MYLHPIVLAILAIIIILALVLIFTQFKEIEQSAKHLSIVRRRHDMYREQAIFYKKRFDSKVTECNDLHLRNAELSAQLTSLPEAESDLAFNQHTDEAFAIVGEQPALPGLELVSAGSEN